MFDHLTTGLCPVEVVCRNGDRPDLCWVITQKGDDCVVILFNYSLKREELVSRRYGTGKIVAEDARLRVYKYKVVASAGRQNWCAVIDETRHPSQGPHCKV